MPRLLFGAGLCVLGAAALWRSHPFANAALVRLRNDFVPAPAFRLVDSLPALSNGLTGLEAFALSLRPGTPTLANRTLWLTDSLDTLHFDYHTERSPFDSVILYVAVDGTLHRRVERRARTVRWSVPAHEAVDGWTEAAAACRTFPPRFRVQVLDSSVAPFERVEGAALHLVANAYADRFDDVLPPDTSTPAPPRGETTLLARGDALAVINPSSKPLSVALLTTARPGRRLLRVPARTARVYRKALRDGGPWLAYTGAGEALCALGTCSAREKGFFVLETEHGK